MNDHTILDLLEEFRGTGVIVRFIEYMDVGTINEWRERDIMSSAELVKMISDRWPIEPLERSYHGEVASRYAFTDGQGELGFISSVSAPFCGACTRARLSIGRPAVYLSVCGAGHRSEGAHARGRVRRRTARGN